MRPIACLVSLAVFCAANAFAAPAEPPPAADAVFDMEFEPMPVDRPETIDGVDLACTGVGETRADPRWATYPLRVEFSDAHNAYLTDALVALVDAKGVAVLMVRCDGPWLLLKPPPGTYAVYAQLMGSPAKVRSARVTVPAHGQKRVVLQFPDA